MLELLGRTWSRGGAQSCCRFVGVARPRVCRRTKAGLSLAGSRGVSTGRFRSVLAACAIGLGLQGRRPLAISCCTGGGASGAKASVASSSAAIMEEMRGFGYEYKDGVLVQVGTDKGFEFRDQKHYDGLADAVLRYVGTLLVDSAGLNAISLPLGQDVAAGLNAISLPLGQDTGPRSVIFASPGYQEAEKLLLIIQGSGRVRVGVWGCALCINKDLDYGTMLPYLKKAHEQGYAVIVLNPNENFVDGEPVPGSESPAAHVEYVVRKILVPSCRAAKEGGIIDVVAHSNGGRALLDFLGHPPTSPDEAVQIRRVVLTDSYHDSDEVDMLPAEAKAMLVDATRVVNYVPDAAPIGTPVEEWKSLGTTMTQSEKGCACVSAEAPDHASTNHCALNAAFEFFAA